MKNYTITVNGNVYDVTVEENGAGAAPKAAPKAPKAAPKAAPAPKAPAKAAGAGSVRRQHPPGRAGGLPPTVRSRQFPSLHPDVPRAPQENSG